MQNLSFNHLFLGAFTLHSMISRAYFLLLCCRHILALKYYEQHPHYFFRIHPKQERWQNRSSSAQDPFLSSPKVAVFNAPFLFGPDIISFCLILDIRKSKSKQSKPS